MMTAYLSTLHICLIVCITVTFFLLPEDGSVAVGSVIYQTLSVLLPNNTIKYRIQFFFVLLHNILLQYCSYTKDSVGIAGVILSTQLIGDGSFTDDPIELNFQVTVSQKNSTLNNIVFAQHTLQKNDGKNQNFFCGFFEERLAC